MRSRPIGGREVPVIGLGTWMMELDGRDETFDTIREAVDLGAHHIDTAEMYGAGKVEEIVGEALDGIRDKVFLVSKVVPSNASYDGTIKACEASLERLRTDHLDVYLLHWPGTHPFEETVRAFEHLVKDGKILAYGVSNFDVDEMVEAVRTAGPGKIACNQIYYHLKERAIEHELIPWCAENHVPVVAYSPFGQGDFPKDNKVLNEIARKQNATPRQVALAFLLRHEGLLTIPKTASLTHLKENVAGAGLALSAADIEAVSSAFPNGPARRLPTI